ncbi:MAG: FAD-dependent oxidoreductase [Spirochaetaceae bacterium]|nr:FAD-dependent oxidoreductase [Spirochaetaceae bacterium]
MERSDILVIGAGLSGLTAAALLAERGLSVTVLERGATPGGSCGSFRRGKVTYDLGAALLFGFDGGYAPHRFVMDELREPVEVYRHEAPYRIHYGEGQVVFREDPERFLDELSALFPGTREELGAFYRRIFRAHRLVSGSSASYLPPSEMRLRDFAPAPGADPRESLAALGLLFSSAESLARKNLRDEGLLRFFDKLTSTYCYTTMPETPAVLAATMFAENHLGGAYAVAGGPAMLAGRLEKAIEARGGRVLYGKEVEAIRFERSGPGRARAAGASCADGSEYTARDVLYAAELRGLAERLLPPSRKARRLARKLRGLSMTYRNFMVYGTVALEALPPGAMPCEVFIDNREAIDEGDVSLYLSSLEDPRLAPEGRCAFLLLGPSFRDWPAPGGPGDGSEAYEAAKREEAERMLALVERRFPGFRAAAGDLVLGSPTTTERYLGKPGGAVAGPKQKMGQALLSRPGARTRWPGLWLAGEWTTMGTGTPAVTVSGIGAADRILRERGLPEFRSRPRGESFVTVIPRGRPGNLPSGELALEAARCLWCERAPCVRACPAGIDLPGIHRRLECGNEGGAARRLKESDRAFPSCAACSPGAEPPCERACARRAVDGRPVASRRICVGTAGVPA